MRRKLLALVFALSMVIIPPQAFGGTADETTSVEGDIRSEAKSVYDNLHNFTVYPGTGEEFADAFSDNVELYYVVDHVREPPIVRAMAWDTEDLVGFDVTEDFNSLLSTDGVTMLTEQEALNVAEAYGEIGNAAIQESRVVVNSSHSEELGYPVEDPYVEQDVGGWSVFFHSWSPTNGVIMYWSVDLTTSEIDSALAEVAAIGKGSHHTTLFASDLDENKWIDNSWSDGNHSITIWNETSDGMEEIEYRSENVDPGYPSYEWDTTRENEFDDSYWRVTYPGADTGQSEDVQTIGEALAEAGVHVYSDMVEYNDLDYPRNDIVPDCSEYYDNDEPNWGFAEPDTDCEYHIHMRDAMTFYPTVAVENGGAVEIHVSPWFEQDLNAHGYYLGPAEHNTSTVSQTVLANAYYRHHMFQRDVPQTDAITDGLPRLAQVVSSPAVEHTESSLFYGEFRDTGTDDNPTAATEARLAGANGIQSMPWSGLCANSNEFETHKQAGSAALAFGFFANHFDDIEDDGEELRQVLADLPKRSECSPEDMVDATSSFEGAESTTNIDPLLDFGLAVFEKDLSWSVEGETRDWGKFLDDVYTHQDEISNDTFAHTWDVSAYAQDFVELPTNKTIQVGCDYLDGEMATQLIYVNHDGSVENQRAYCQDQTYEIEEGSYDRIVANTVNPGSSAKGYWLFW